MEKKVSVCESFLAESDDNHGDKSTSTNDYDCNTSNDEKYEFNSNKQLYALPRASHSSSTLNTGQTTSSKKISKKRAKLLHVNKKSNNSISDIEAEDDLMFNEDDSLSSTIELSQNTLVYGANCGSLSKKLSDESPSLTINIINHHVNNVVRQAIPSEGTLRNKQSLTKMSTSMSDIEPDENILTNLLIKN